MLLSNKLWKNRSVDDKGRYKKAGGVEYKKRCRKKHWEIWTTMGLELVGKYELSMREAGDADPTKLSCHLAHLPASSLNTSQRGGTAIWSQFFLCGIWKQISPLKVSHAELFLLRKAGGRERKALHGQRQPSAMQWQWRRSPGGS